MAEIAEIHGDALENVGREDNAKVRAGCDALFKEAQRLMDNLDHATERTKKAEHTLDLVSDTVPMVSFHF